LTIEVPDDITHSELKERVNEAIDDNSDFNDWDETDYYGNNSVEVYDTYSGCTLIGAD
jgi:hypothetical protein